MLSHTPMPMHTGTNELMLTPLHTLTPTPMQTPMSKHTPRTTQTHMPLPMHTLMPSKKLGRF